MMYNMLKDDAENNITYNNTNWAYQLKNMLNWIGLTEVWLNQDIDINNNVNLPYIKQRILDNYYQSWFSDIDRSQRLASYSRYKH